MHIAAHVVKFMWRWLDVTNACVETLLSHDSAHYHLAFLKATYMSHNQDYVLLVLF